MFVVLSIGTDDNLQKDAIKSFRVLRVLRPLKAINKSKKLKVRFSVICSLYVFNHHVIILIKDFCCCFIIITFEGDEEMADFSPVRGGVLL